MNGTANDPIEAELAQAGSASGLSPNLLELEKNRITSSKVLPPMEFLFSLFDELCFPRRELVAFTGRAKSGKTFVISILMTLCVAREILTFKRMADEPLRVLWYDTEQSDNSTQDILVNRIIPLFQRTMGDDEAFPEHMFDIFNVRNVDRAHREAYFLEAIEHYRPDLVILDGIRDLVSDINDGSVAQDRADLQLLHGVRAPSEQVGRQSRPARLVGHRVAQQSLRRVCHREDHAAAHLQARTALHP